MEIDKKLKDSLEKSYLKQDKVINYTPSMRFNEKTRTLDVVEYDDDVARKETGRNISFKEQVARLGLSATLSSFKNRDGEAVFNDTTIVSKDINEEWKKLNAHNQKVQAINEKINAIEQAALSPEREQEIKAKIIQENINKEGNNNE